MKITSFDETPNPNALKVSVAARLGEGTRPLYHIPDPHADPIGHALMSIPGVRHILITDTWFTINKHEQAPWKPIKEAARRALNRF